MSDSIKIFVPVKPSPASRPRVTKFGTYYPKNHKTCERAYLSFLRGLDIKEFTGPVFLSLVFHLTKPKSAKRELPSVKPDIDNYSKLIMDCLEKVGAFKDGQVCTLHASKIYSEREGVGVVIKNQC